MYVAPVVSSTTACHYVLSTLLVALQCSISVSWFCDHRACISLLIGGRTGTDTAGFAGCRRVERTVYFEEHTHTMPSCKLEQQDLKCFDLTFKNLRPIAVSTCVFRHSTFVRLWRGCPRRYNGSSGSSRSRFNLIYPLAVVVVVCSLLV